MSRPPVTMLRVNPIACVAHGLCAEILPEHVTLDEWGYPIIDAAPIPSELHRLARQAADACPTLALIRQESSATKRASGS